MLEWRFIDSGNNSGPENMAMDEALLQLFDSHRSSPVLRLYGWSPPALSLGRFQKADEVLDLKYCRSVDVPIVRRITGGGVIFHAEELTYSIVCSQSQIPESDSIKDSFRILTGFLLEFYRSLDLVASYAMDCNANGEKLGERTSYCFAGKESFDILIDGHKIGGNAQRRMKQVIFQHGSIPLTRGPQDGTQFLRVRPAGLNERVTFLYEVTEAMDHEFLKSKLRSAFCDNLNAILQVDRLTSAEVELAANLKYKKYLTDSWNIGGESD